MVQRATLIGYTISREMAGLEILRSCLLGRLQYENIPDLAGGNIADPDNESLF